MRYRISWLVPLIIVLLTACSEISLPELERPAPRPTGDGELVVRIAGLPDDVNAIVDITGPNEYSASIQASSTLRRLVTGYYSLDITNVQVDGDTYHGVASQNRVQVTNLGPAEVDVTYRNIGGIGRDQIAPGVRRSGTVTTGSFDDYRFEAEFNVPMRFAFARTDSSGYTYPYRVSIFDAEDTEFRNALFSWNLRTANQSNLDFSAPESGAYVLRVSGTTSTAKYEVEASYL